MANTFNFDAMNNEWIGRLRSTGQPNTPPSGQPPTIDGVTGEIDGQTGPGPAWLHYIPEGVRDLVASHLPPGLSDIPGQGFSPPRTMPFRPNPAPAAAPLPEGAQFLSRSFTNPAGTRPYKVYVPSTYVGKPVALIVMLHGCTQSPDDFAAGTGMNQAAEQQDFLVVYPGQTSTGHPQKCWKWFSPEDQRRGTGEPSLIAGITRQVMQDYAVDPRRVYVAGLSAGGAAASIMAETYPELYAAAGVHSGLACGAAHDLPSALAAMRGGATRAARPAPQRRTPTIIFHGDQDSTVSPHNAGQVAAQSLGGTSTRTQVQTGQAPGGHAYSRTVHLDGKGEAITEQWLIHGAGHAWSGGSKAGSYADPRGPDATREMLRFFWSHPHAAPG